MLFHLDAVWRFNETAILPEVGCFSSVSRGPFLAGLLAVQWTMLRSHEIEKAADVYLQVSVRENPQS